MWKTSRNADPICQYEKYRQIFCGSFNLGFGNPREDVCSYCESVKLKIKASERNEKQKLITEYRIHKLKAKKFYQLMKTNRENEVTVCFDMQQNQPLPKLAVSEVFYARQVWLYNLAVLVKEKPQTIDNTWLYTWLETEAQRGANEVASAVFHFLEGLDNRLQAENNKNLTLKLFSDSCSSQNKNTVMMCTVRAFLSVCKSFDKVVYYFPIRGHSYMPPDRVFGRIKKTLRKKEKIVSPAEYHEILKDHGMVKVLNKDWNIFDYKDVSKKIMMLKLGMKMQEQKVFTYVKGTDDIGVQSSYNGSPIFVPVLRKKRKFDSMLSAKAVVKKNCVKVAKMNDVKKLLSFFQMPDDAETKQFYKDVLAATDTSNDDDGKMTYEDEEDVVL